MSRSHPIRPCRPSSTEVAGRRGRHRATAVAVLVCCLACPPSGFAADDEPALMGETGEDRAPTRAELEQAVRDAEAAADEAWIAARAATDGASGSTWGRARRNGPYVGAAFLYAAEHFDDSIIVKSSFGGSAFAGYRADGFVAAEVRFEGFNGFDLKGSNGRGELDGFAVTVNAKLYPFSGPIEPFVGAGVGGMRLKARTVLNSGSRLRSEASDAVVRVFGGLDLPLSEHVALTFEAAYLVPLGDLEDLDVLNLSGGLAFYF